MRSIRLRLTTVVPLALAGPAAAQPAAMPAPAYRALVSAANPHASAAGLDMLRAGGSAADAAIATMLALTVVEPQSSGIGGGGFLVYQPPGGKPVTLDGRETAPAVASPKQFLKADGTPLSFAEAATGGRSVGVPGNVRLAAAAHRRWGKLPWARLFEPAIRLAEGFTVSPQLARFAAFGRDGISRDADASALYLPGGQPVAAGTRLANPALAATLRAIAARGPDEFYRGATARAIVAKVNGAAANPTGMTAKDIAGYRVAVRAPVCGRYRVWTVCGMGPPSSGAVGVLQMLGQLERFDVKALGSDSPIFWHLFAESQRLAYADRDKWIGDPGFVTVPVTGLIDPVYIRARSALIAPDRRLARVAAGLPAGAPPRVAAADNEVAGTSSFAVGDASGAMLSYTSTIERTFGSGLVAGGFALNNELTDFNFDPAEPRDSAGPGDSGGALTANRVAPGKRPRSSMSPTIVYDAAGKAVLAIGAAGGTTIIAQVTKAIIGVVDFGLPVQDAIALPQLFAIADRLAVEKGTKLETMVPALQALGHTPVAVALPLKLNGVERTAGGWRGGADPRGEGQVLGY